MHYCTVMNLKSSLTVAILLGLGLLATWEWYWQSQGYQSELDDNKALWAINRAKVDHLSSKDVIILGSSRAHFDLQLNEWEEITGKRPIMLASDGTTPSPVFKDIVENTDFKGTVVIGVAPGLFFSAEGKGFMWNRAQVRIDYFYDQTYAQKANHLLSLPLERSFSFLNGSEEQWTDDIDLKTLVNSIHFGDRGGPPPVPFNNFGFVDNDRNVTMFEKTKTDTAFANTIINAWRVFSSGAPPAALEPMVGFYNKLITKLEARGGSVIFLRLPSSGSVRERELAHIPREKFWDVFLVEVNSPGYHFEDYPQLNQFTCPEESHLYTPDARILTKELLQIMIQDKLISKTN